MKNTSKQQGAAAKGGDGPAQQRDRKGGDALSDRELFRKMIESLYQPREDIPGGKQLMTSRDLQYRFRDMCTVNVSTVAEVMQELGYQFCFVLGIPYWEVYDLVE